MYQGMMKSRYDQGNQSYELEGGGLLDILCSVHDADFFNESRLLILKFACKTRTRTKEKTVLVLNLLYSFRIRR